MFTKIRGKAEAILVSFVANAIMLAAPMVARAQTAAPVVPNVTNSALYAEAVIFSDGNFGASQNPNYIPQFFGALAYGGDKPGTPPSGLPVGSPIGPNAKINSDRSIYLGDGIDLLDTKGKGGQTTTTLGYYFLYNSAQNQQQNGVWGQNDDLGVSFVRSIGTENGLARGVEIIRPVPNTNTTTVNLQAIWAPIPGQPNSALVGGALWVIYANPDQSLGAVFIPGSDVASIDPNNTTGKSGSAVFNKLEGPQGTYYVNVNNLGSLIKTLIPAGTTAVAFSELTYNASGPSLGTAVATWLEIDETEAVVRSVIVPRPRALIQAHVP